MDGALLGLRVVCLLESLGGDTSSSDPITSRIVSKIHTVMKTHVCSSLSQFILPEKQFVNKHVERGGILAMHECCFPARVARSWHCVLSFLTF